MVKNNDKGGDEMFRVVDDRLCLLNKSLCVAEQLTETTDSDSNSSSDILLNAAESKGLNSIVSCSIWSIPNRGLVLDLEVGKLTEHGESDCPGSCNAATLAAHTTWFGGKCFYSSLLYGLFNNVGARFSLVHDWGYYTLSSRKFQAKCEVFYVEEDLSIGCGHFGLSGFG